MVPKEERGGGGGARVLGGPGPEEGADQFKLEREEFQKQRKTKMGKRFSKGRAIQMSERSSKSGKRSLLRRVASGRGSE